MGVRPPPPPPPSVIRAALSGTRVARTYEPDDPELGKKKIRPFRLTELEHIPKEHRDIHRALLRAMPEAVFEPGFSRRLADMLKGYLGMDIDLWLDSYRIIETGRLRSLIPGPRCIVVVGLQPRPEKILVEIDLRFVYTAIDKLLGGKGGAVDIQRPLTEIEQGVFLFLVLKAAALFYSGFINPEQLALRIEDIRSDVRGAADIVKHEERWLCVAWKLFFELDVGHVRVLVPHALARGMVLDRAPPDSPLAERVRARVRERLRPFAGVKTDMWAEIGRIELSREDLEQLEAGDIVLIEGSEVTLSDGEATGNAVMRLGVARHGHLRGAVRNEGGQYVFEVQEIVIEKIPGAHDPIEGHGEHEDPEQVVAAYEEGPASEEGAGYGSDEDESSGVTGGALPDELFDEDWGIDDEDHGDEEEYEESYEEGGEYQEAEQYEEGGDYQQGEQGGEGGEEGGGEEAPPDDNLAEAEPLLGDIPMVLVVELGRVQLSADEVIRLRPGQLIELGRSPADPVDLVVNGKLVAKGELVEIDGALGVKLVRLAKGEA